MEKKEKIKQKKMILIRIRSIKKREKLNKKIKKKKKFKERVKEMKVKNWIIILTRS